MESKYLTCVFLKCNFEKVLSYGKSVLLNWSKDKCLCKNKNPQIQMINFQILVWVFCDSKLKNYCNIWTHHHRINQFANIRAKILKTWIWKQKCLIWVLLGYKFKKASVTFEIIIPKLVRNEFLAKIMNFGIGSKVRVHIIKYAFCTCYS